MLRRSTARKFWRWDEGKIYSMNTSYNVGELVKDRLRKMPAKSLTVLKILSCLGQTFEEESACVIIDKMDTAEMFDVNISKEETAGCFGSLVRRGFLERHDLHPARHLHMIRSRSPSFNLFPTTINTVHTSRLLLHQYDTLWHGFFLLVSY